MRYLQTHIMLRQTIASGLSWIPVTNKIPLWFRMFQIMAALWEDLWSFHADDDDVGEADAMARGGSRFLGKVRCPNGAHVLYDMEEFVKTGSKVL